MVVAAVALSVAWLVVAVGVRVVVQVRRTGDTGLRAPGAWASVEGVVGVAILAGGALVVAGPLLVAAGLHGRPAPQPVVPAVGALLAVVGVVSTFLAQLGMGDAWRVGVDTGERTPLVTSGPFSMVRNPIFTAMVATAAGLALMVPTTVGVVAAVLTVVAVEAQVRLVEEPYLRAVHGGAYRAYQRSVGRFVPGVGRSG